MNKADDVGGWIDRQARHFRRPAMLYHYEYMNVLAACAYIQFHRSHYSLPLQRICKLVRISVIKNPFYAIIANEMGAGDSSQCPRLHTQDHSFFFM